MKAPMVIAILAMMLAFAVSATGQTKQKKPATPAKVVSPTELFRQGYEAYMRFDCPKALQLFRKGLQQKPDAKAYYFVGNCERWRGDQMAARLAYTQGAEIPSSQTRMREDVYYWLDDAMESLDLAFDSTKLTDFFKAKARNAGIEPPAELSLRIDPRLVPVRLDGALKVSSGDNWNAYTNTRERSIAGLGISISAVDVRRDRKMKSTAYLTDPDGTQYRRDMHVTTTSVNAGPVQGWVEYFSKYTTVIYAGDSPRYSETRCKRKGVRIDQNNPVLDFECVTQTQSAYSGAQYSPAQVSFNLINGRVP